MPISKGICGCPQIPAFLVIYVKIVRFLHTQQGLSYLCPCDCEAICTYGDFSYPRPNIAKAIPNIKSEIPPIIGDVILEAIGVSQITINAI